jgi:hypothetical protein
VRRAAFATPICRPFAKGRERAREKAPAAKPHGSASEITACSERVPVSDVFDAAAGFTAWREDCRHLATKIVSQGGGCRAIPYGNVFRIAHRPAAPA